MRPAREARAAAQRRIGQLVPLIVLSALLASESWAVPFDGFSAKVPNTPKTVGKISVAPLLGAIAFECSRLWRLSGKRQPLFKQEFTNPV